MRVEIIVELDVSLPGRPTWRSTSQNPDKAEVESACQKAVSNALKQVEDMGFTHPLEGKLSIHVVATH